MNSRGATLRMQGLTSAMFSPQPPLRDNNFAGPGGRAGSFHSKLTLQLLPLCHTSALVHLATPLEWVASLGEGGAAKGLSQNHVVGGAALNGLGSNPRKHGVFWTQLR